MDGIWIVALTSINQQHGPRRVCTTRFVAMRICAVDQCLIGEIQFRRPVQTCTAAELAPLLIDHAGRWIAPALGEQLAIDHGEMFAVFGIAQAQRGFQVRQNIEVGLAEGREGIQCVGVLAEEIVVPIIIKAGDRVGIDIGAGIEVWRAAAIGRVTIVETAIAAQTLAVI